MGFFMDALKNYFNFSGRATRKQYWMFYLFYILFLILLTVLDVMLDTYNEEVGMGLLSGIFALLMFIPSLSILFRRFHDIGRSGWWILLFLIPLIGPIVILIFTILDSKPEENKWGVSLKYGNQAEPDATNV